MIEVKQIRAEETRPLRHLVLWPHIAEEKDCVIDIDHRKDAMHFAVSESGVIVAVCSLFEQSSPKLSSEKQVRLRAMATHPDVRGKHYGRKLVEFVLLQATQKGYEVLWCDARIKAVGFYTNLGFDILPEIYDVPKIGPHQFMWRQLISSP